MTNKKTRNYNAEPSGRTRISFAANEPLLIVDPAESAAKRGRRRDPLPEMGLIDSLKHYPPGVFFMLGNEFCERFSFYGMRAILTLYLIHEHHFSESTATFFYHAFVCLAYFSPLFGSIAADNFFGRFRVILWVSMVYVGGHVLLSIGAIPNLHTVLRSFMDFGGLVVIALATGGIKPCVSAFAADQFDESQQNLRTQFFSFFYFAINAGSLVAIMLTPILRGRVQCFGSEYCFPLAFGVPGVLMLIAFVIFLFGWRFYKITPAEKGNLLWKVCKCIGYAVKRKFSTGCCRKQEKPVEHWLDYSAPKYGDQLVAGVKSLFAVSILFIPVVFFWALYDQQGSTWVLQARRMDGRIGPITVLPDQINTVNPLIIIIMVPVFEAWIYPAVRKVVKVTPLRKMAFGGILAAIAFVMAGFVQLEVNNSMEPKPDDANIFVQRFGNVSDPVLLNGTDLPIGKSTHLSGVYPLKAGNTNFDLNLTKSQGAYVLGLFSSPDNTKTSMTLFPYVCEKSENGRTRIYLLLSSDSYLNGGNLFVVDHDGVSRWNITIQPGAYVDIQPPIISSPDYTIKYGKNCTTPNDCPYQKEIYAQMGAAHVLHVIDNNNLPELYTVVRPNTVSMMWQLPQFFVITIGELLFSITGLEFSYSQASPNMKSVLTAVWLMTTFLGNAIDMGISGSHIVSEPAAEFFVYAGLMLLVMVIFILMAMNYTYVDESTFEKSPTPTEVDEHELPEKKLSALEPKMTTPKHEDIPPIDKTESNGNDEHHSV